MKPLQIQTKCYTVSFQQWLIHESPLAKRWWWDIYSQACEKRQELGENMLDKGFEGFYLRSEQNARRRGSPFRPFSPSSPSRMLGYALAACLVLSAGCKVDEPQLPTGPTSGSDSTTGTGTAGGSTGGTGTSTAITAPIISDPLSGSTLTATQPELAVLNSARQGGEAPTYLFQVSPASSFETLSAQSDQVPENAAGSTRWQVDRPLEDGTYFWRVRARSGTADSDFSSTAQFIISVSGTPTPPPPSPTPPPPAPPPSGLVISDPLAGGSIGDVHGGRFVGGGWQVSSPGDFIRYEIPPTASGFVEFETTGLRPSNPSPDQFMLFGMWDPSAGPYRANAFRVHLQKLHPNPHNPPWLRLRWIADNEQHDEGSQFVSWDPSRSYQWRIEWGPSGSEETARVFLDGNLEIVVNYRNVYRPSMHFVELGVGERGESVVGVTYRNLRIGN